jgi:hypothetical protein
MVYSLYYIIVLFFRQFVLFLQDDLIIKKLKYATVV